MSDTHLGSRQYMRDDRENDFYEAFREAIGIAIDEKVDFIVHSGDLFDTWSPSNRALSEFKDTALKLREAGIPMFLIMGDHDRPKRTDYPAARIFDFLGIRLLGQEGVEEYLFGKDGEEVLIVGISNLKGSRRDQLLEEYEKADLLAKGHRNSILLSHQGITGFLIDDACEAKYDDLPKNFSYLAFGHVHEGGIRRERYPVFSYAGSTEMKSTREIQAFTKNGKSVNLVTLVNGEVDVKRIKLSSVRFQYLIDTNFENYLNDIESMISQYSGSFANKTPLVTLRINGNGDHDEVKRNLARYTEINFRPPEFISGKTEIEARPGMDSAEDYIKAYFKDNTNLADLASEFYRHVKSDREDGMKWLRSKLGIGDMQ